MYFLNEFIHLMSCISLLIDICLVYVYAHAFVSLFMWCAWLDQIMKLPLLERLRRLLGNVCFDPPIPHVTIHVLLRVLLRDQESLIHARFLCFLCATLLPHMFLDASTKFRQNVFCCRRPRRPWRRCIFSCREARYPRCSCPTLLACNLLPCNCRAWR